MSNEETVAQVVDRWLAKIPEIICFTERLKIYAPTCRGKCKGDVNVLTEEINRIFGGSTIYGAVTGCWFDKDESKVICEPVKVIEVGHNCSTKKELGQLMEAITNYATKTGQKSLSIHNGKFYIAETPELVKEYEKLKEKISV